MSADPLYFIALVPPLELRARIEVLKEEMQRRFGARHALKAPAHLTLQMPFRHSPEQEQELLAGLAGFAADTLTSRFHPHITIATRDLAEPAFNTAWAEFESREFRAAFEANSLFLLRHNGRAWAIHREFGFGGGRRTQVKA